MIDVPNSNLQVKCFIGAPQTGRTNALVREAARCAEEGANVLFVCARKRDVRKVRQLVDALGADGDCSQRARQAQLDAVGSRRESRSRLCVVGADCLAGDLSQNTTDSIADGDSAKGFQNSANADEGASCGPSREVASYDMHIVTCADVAQGILSSPEAQAMFGRGPRLLESYEESVLLEDLKVSQMKNRRLRKVLAYLRAGWSNLSDDAWEQTAEEDLVIDRMRANLQFTGGVLRCEASNLALHALRAHEALRQRASCDYVFVDDFELLSRASQHLVRMLASCGLVVASGEYPSLTGDEEYPCFEGTSELLEAFPAAQVARLHESQQSPAVRHIVQGLLTDQALSPLVAGVSQGYQGAGWNGLAEGVSSSTDANDEVAAFAAPSAGSGCEQGTTAETADEHAVPQSEPSRDNAANGDNSSALRMQPSLETELQALAIASNDALERGETVLIVGTNRLWRRNVAANLRRVGLPAQEMRAASLRLRDFQDEKQCARARRDAVARLAADSADGVAWRTLLALGDGVARSAAVDYLRRAVEGECGCSGAPIRLHEALELLEAGKVAGDELTTPLFDDLLAAYRAAKASVAVDDLLQVDASSASHEASGCVASVRSGDIASSCELDACSESVASGGVTSGQKTNAGKASVYEATVGKASFETPDREALRCEANVCSSEPGREVPIRKMLGHGAPGQESDFRRGVADGMDVSHRDSATADATIWVASPEQAAGLRFDMVLFGGFVNGLIPCRAYCDPVGMADESRRREHAKDVRTVYGVASCARKQLLFTGFSTCNLQAAETMDVHIQSIKLRKGMRIVITQPSELANLLS